MRPPRADEPAPRATSTCATSGRASRRSTRRSSRRWSRTCSARVRRGLRGRRELERARRCPRATATPGTESTYVKQPPYFEGMRGAARGFDGSRARAHRRCSATASPPTTSRRPGRSRRTPGRQVPARARRRAQGLQLLRLAPRQPRGDDARHVRQRAPAQPARARHRGRLHRPSRTARSEDDLRRRDGVRRRGPPLCVLAGKEYGSGSSRDWAAKGPRLLGIGFVIAESYERIHRSNLVGMGVLPLQFPDGESAESLGLTGEETFDLAPLEDGRARRCAVTADGGARVRGPGAHRHAERVAVLPPRRHPALRAAPAARLTAASRTTSSASAAARRTCSGSSSSWSAAPGAASRAASSSSRTTRARPATRTEG